MTEIAIPSLILIVEALSPRELEVLTELSGEGQSNTAIGIELFISEKTVRTHLANIFEKLGATTRTQAVLTAQHLGLVAIPGLLSPQALGLLAYVRAYPQAMAELVASGAIQELVEAGVLHE